jgi:hypothetical protein
MGYRESLVRTLYRIKLRLPRHSIAFQRPRRLSGARASQSAKPRKSLLIPAVADSDGAIDEDVHQLTRSVDLQTLATANSEDDFSRVAAAKETAAKLTARVTATIDGLELKHRELMEQCKEHMREHRSLQGLGGERGNWRNHTHSD